MDCARDGFSATMSTVFIPASGCQGLCLNCSTHTQDNSSEKA